MSINYLSATTSKWAYYTAPSTGTQEPDTDTDIDIDEDLDGAGGSGSDNSTAVSYEEILAQFGENFSDVQFSVDSYSKNTLSVGSAAPESAITVSLTEDVLKAMAEDESFSSMVQSAIYDFLEATDSHQPLEGYSLARSVSVSSTNMSFSVGEVDDETGTVEMQQQLEAGLKDGISSIVNKFFGVTDTNGGGNVEEPDDNDGTGNVEEPDDNDGTSNVEEPDDNDGTSNVEEPDDNDGTSNVEEPDDTGGVVDPDDTDEIDTVDELVEQITQWLKDIKANESTSWDFNVNYSLSYLDEIGSYAASFNFTDGSSESSGATSFYEFINTIFARDIASLLESDEDSKTLTDALEQLGLTGVTCEPKTSKTGFELTLSGDADSMLMDFLKMLADSRKTEFSGEETSDDVAKDAEGTVPADA